MVLLLLCLPTSFCFQATPAVKSSLPFSPFFPLNGKESLRTHLTQQETCAYTAVFRESGDCSCRTSTTLAQDQFSVQAFFCTQWKESEPLAAAAAVPSC